MTEWRNVTLGSISSKIGSGATPRGGESVYTSDGITLIRSQNVRDNSMKLDGIARIDEGAADALRGVTVYPSDVLINITGDSVARCSIVDPALLPARVNQHVAIIRTTHEADPRYIQKLLVSPQYKSQLLTIATGGGTRNALTKAQLSDLEIPLPPISVQHAIAEVLGALDEKIAANTALATAAEAVAVAEMSHLGGRVRLGDLVEHRKEQLAPSAFADQVVEHYSLPTFDSAALPSLDAGGDIKSGKFALRSPSVLLSKLNPRFPRIWRATPNPEHLALASTEFLVLEPIDVTSALLWTALAQPPFSLALESRVAGTSGSHQRVRPDDALAVEVTDVRTASDELARFVEASLAAADLHRRQNLTLAATRDALLPQLMSGKLRVRDAEAAASAAGA